jgi:hypothetical protein
MKELRESNVRENEITETKAGNPIRLRVQSKGTALFALEGKKAVFANVQALRERIG